MRYNKPVALACPSWLVLALLMLSMLVTACGSGGPGAASTIAPTTASNADAAASGEAPSIVATFSVLGHLVREVAGQEAEVTVLVGPGVDAHTFEPSPADNRKLVEADLIFENGLGFETWLDDLYESSDSDARRVVVTQGMENLIDADEHEAEEEHAEEEGTHEAEEEHEEEAHEGEGEATHEGEEHGHGEYDPHVWHDVNNAIYMVERIRDSLAEADASNAARYRGNAERYISELRELDEYVVEQVATLPEDQRKLVTTHDTFGYFARRYGFEIVDTALGITTEESEPSAAEMAELIQEIRAAEVPELFTENVSNSGVMERVAQETGAKIAPPLYTDALGEPGSEGATYIEMERYNVKTIVGALKR